MVLGTHSAAEHDDTSEPAAVPRVIDRLRAR
jgi:hypothetical protein